MANELNVEDGEYSEPVSPTAQYLNSSVLSVCILAVFDSEIPVDDSPALGLLKDVFLPISPRFSSLMISSFNILSINIDSCVVGKTRPRKTLFIFVSLYYNQTDRTSTQVIFVVGGEAQNRLSPQSYDNHLSNYLSKIAMEQLPHNRPLWNIHIIKYPTSNAAGNLIFKLHHSLGDGYSLMAALLSCLQRADSPSVPLTFPTLTSAPNPNLSVGGTSIFRNIPKVLRSAFNTVSDFGWSLMKSSYVEDDISLIRSGNPGVEFKLVLISTMTFSLDDIKQIKTKLRVTINVVITGIIFLGTRLYMQEGRNKSTNEHSTALVLLNTKAIREYKSVKEIHKPYAEKVWGNQFAFLHNSIPELTSLESLNPLDFNSSMALSNIIGPVEQMALANHPIKSLYFMMVGGPEILTVTMFSYMGKLRVAFKTEKGFIDPEKLKSSIHNAFEMMLK
ncbi:hypothetical protein E1A91_D04G166700v1, partial [Gossypium mustelinum]